MKILHRDLDAPQLKEENVITLSVASSIPYLRTGKNGEYFEVLEISEDAIDFIRLVDGRCPLLYEHDTEKQIGVVERAYISDGKLYVDVRFSDSEFAQQVYKDIVSGIRRNTSIGYTVDEYIMQDSLGIAVKTKYVTKWTPLEVSSVSVPADCEVGYKRSAELEDDAEDKPEEKECGEEPKEDKEAEDEKPAEEKEEEKPIETADENKECGEEPKEDKEEPKDEGDSKEAEDEEKPEDKECDEDAEKIKALGLLTNNSALAEQFIKNKKSFEDFKNELKKEPYKDNDKTMEKKHFSLAKALLNRYGHISNEDAAYERQVIEENKAKFQMKTNDVVVSKEQLRAGFDGTADAPLHPAQYRPDLYAGTLPKENTLARVGARVVETAGPSITFAVATSGLNAYYVAANGAVPSANAAFAQVEMKPHRYGAYTDISFISELQDNPNAEAIAFDELYKGLDYIKDQKAFQGTGSNGEPSGLLNTAGVNTVSVTGTVELSTALAFEKAIRDSGDYSSDLKWVFGTEAYYKWANTPVKSTAVNEFLVDYKTGRCIGYEAVCSPAVPASAVILGNFNEMLVADFKAVELSIKDDATLGLSDTVRVIGRGANDVAVRRPASFTKGI